MKPITALGLLAAAVALASCQSDRAPRELPPIRQQPTGVEGAWVDANGLVSTFAAGQFETRTTDTQVKMATGTYLTQPSGLVEINLYSNISKTTSKVNCAMIGSTQLNCTSATGTQFSLTRPA
jgi:hypothetical protein